MNAYGRALILGDVQGFPEDVAKHLPTCLYFVHAYLKKGTSFETLLDYLVKKRTGQTKWLIDPLKLKNGELRPEAFAESFDNFKCECLLIFTHSKTGELPYYLQAAIGAARAYNKPYQIIKLPPPKKVVDYEKTGQAMKKIRENNEMTAGTLAKSLSRRNRDISGIENGVIKPKVKTYEAIASTLNCKTTDFLKYK